MYVRDHFKYQPFLEATGFQEDEIIFPGRACMREM